MSGDRTTAETGQNGAVERLAGASRPSGPNVAPEAPAGPHAASRPDPAIVLITGSRDYANQQELDQALNAAWNEALARGFNELAVVHGGARGADRLADGWARRRSSRGVTVRRFPADWNGPCTAECKPGHRRSKRAGGNYCPAEGTRRNQRMVEHVLGAAVPGGVLAIVCWVEASQCHGTRDCLGRIEAAGLPFRELGVRPAGAR